MNHAQLTTPLTSRLPRWPLIGLAMSIALTIARILFFPPIPAAGGSTVYDDTALNIAYCLAFGAIGALIARRQPENRFASLIVAQTVLATLTTVSNAYVNAYINDPAGTRHGLLVSTLVLLLNYVIWFPGYTGALLAFPLLFPDARLPSPRWRWPAILVAATVLGICLLSTSVGVVAVVYGPLDQFDQLGPDTPAWVRSILNVIKGAFQVLFVGVTPVCFVVSLSALIARFRSAGPGERRQIKWFVIFAGLAVVQFVPMYVFGTALEGGAGWVLYSQPIFVLLIGVGTGISILRGKLWDIDIVIRRTLIYVALTLLLGTLYIALITMLQQGLVALTGRGNSQLVTVASTLVVAGAFLPLRNRLQRWIDRRFYRRKYDAEQVAARFAEDMRNAVDMDEIATKLCGVVEETMQPHKTVLWLPGGGKRHESNGERDT